MAAKKENESKNIIARGIGFSQDSWTEFNKISFPTRDETVRWTIAVFFMMVFFSLFLGATDWIVGGMMRSILM